MTQNPRSEFEIDRPAVRAEARTRLLIRISVLIVLIGVFGLAVNAWVPDKSRTLAWSFAITLAAVYAAVEVSALGWSRRSAPTMVLRLSEHGLELWIGPGRHLMRWTDLRIVRVKVREGRVRAIELDSRDTGRVRLAGFRHMDELAQALTANIAAQRADR